MPICRWWLLLVVLTGLTAGESGPSEALARLLDAQTRLQGVCATANLALPGALGDVLIVRRTIGADWQRRIAAGEARGDDPLVRDFTAGVERLADDLTHLANLAELLGDAPRRFPHCLGEPAYATYRTLVSESFTKDLHALITGRPGAAASLALVKRQQRQVALLEVIEEQHLAAERYTTLPHDDRWLVEYREHLLLIRTTRERTLDLPDEPDEHRQEEVREGYVALLDLRLAMAETIADHDLPPDAPEVQVFRRVGERRIAALARQITFARVVDQDDDHWRQVEAHEREQWRADLFGGYAAAWLALAVQQRQIKQQIEVQIERTAAETAAGFRRQVEEGFTTYRTALEAFIAAVTADDPVAALAAKHAAGSVMQRLERRLLRLHDESAMEEREQAWRQHAADPAVAAKLREWDVVRRGWIAKRQAADDAWAAALAADQAGERAHLAREQAEHRALAADQAVEDHEILDLMETLDGMVRLRAGVQP